MLLLRTLTGSRLYGTHSTHSDYDYYEVHDHGRSRQSIVDNIDTVRVSLDVFLRHVDAGVPQALESLWSPLADMHPSWRPFLHSIVINPYAAQRTYLRTIRNFNTDTPKKRRHAMRLSMNLDDIMAYGRFNPQLTSNQLEKLYATL